MLDVRKIITSFFLTLQEDFYVLVRIESLVALVTVIFLVMFVLEIFQFHYSWPIMRTFSSILNGVSNEIVIYLLGAMTSANFEKQLFPVWALVLVSLHVSLGYLSGYSLKDREQGLSEVSNVLKLLGAAILTGTRGLGFTRPLWSLWSILQLRTVYRCIALRQAAKSLWHGRSSEFLQEYLREHHEEYLVYGETKQEIKIPQDVRHPKVKPDSLITLDKIKAEWCTAYKDISLAFSLSRLLRCRLEDVVQDLVDNDSRKKLIIAEIKAERIFDILELEFAFVRDYFCSLYPVIFWKGLYSLSFSMLQSIAAFAVTFWLAVDIRNLYKSTMVEEDVVLRLGSVNVDVINTWVFMFFMMFKEVWEVVTYLLSNWTRLLLVCKYARNQRWILGSAYITNVLTSSFFNSKIVHHWHRRIDQYDFLQSYTYNPTFWKLLHSATLGKTPRILDGRKSGDAIKINECVLKAVNQELSRFVSNPQKPHDYSNNIGSLGVQEIFLKYEWALCKLRKCSQSILVWNIATSLCEIQLAKEIPQRLDCCSSQQVVLLRELRDPLKTNYRVAKSLSRYCGYLLAFRSDLLPDSFLVPEQIFNTTLNRAIDLTTCKYHMFMAQDGEVDIERQGIVEQAGRLARDLINEENEVRWEILAAVWTKLLVNIAPSWNAEAHKKSIGSGGEFITLIWALLWHCGIQKSSMWRQMKAEQENNVEETPANSMHPDSDTHGWEGKLMDP